MDFDDFEAIVGAGMDAADAPVGMRPGDDRSTWVIVDRTPDGAYFPAIVVGGDRTWRLEDPAGYATAILERAEDALFDASVVRLMMERLHFDQERAVWFVVELRKDRPDYDDAATLPLVFRPMVGSKDGLPWVTLELDGRTLGRWTPDDARSHAAHAMSAPHVAELDHALVRHLRVGFELSAGAAAAYVHDLVNFRDDHHQGERPG